MNMESLSSNRQPVSLADFGHDVARRRALIEPIDMPRNSGLRRTESKIALLAAIAETGARW